MNVTTKEVRFGLKKSKKRYSTSAQKSKFNTKKVLKNAGTWADKVECSTGREMGVTTKRPNLKRATRAKRQHINKQHINTSTVNTSQQQFFFLNSYYTKTAPFGFGNCKNKIDTGLPNLKHETRQHTKCNRTNWKCDPVAIVRVQNLIWPPCSELFTQATHIHVR